MVEDEEQHNPSEINRVDANKVVESYSGIFFPNKKRKFQAETLDLPLPKHKCSERSFSSEVVYPPNGNPRVDDFDTRISKGKIVDVTKDGESEMESGKDSNSYGGDSDSAMSSAEAKIHSECPKTHPSDMPSTSSVNCDNSIFKNSLYSLDSRLVSKSGVDREKLPYGGDYCIPLKDFGLNSGVNLDEHLLEFGSQIDYSCLEGENDNNIETCIDKDLPPNNYVLSSGRWSVNQETQPTAKKLTIDKEFEQYFSMLMM